VPTEVESLKQAISHNSWETVGRDGLSEFFEPLRTFQVRCPSRVIFGLNSVNQIGLEMKRVGVKNGLIVTDRGVYEAGLLDRVRHPLEQEGLAVDVYDKVELEPAIDSIERLLDHARKNRYEFIVGLGGGSSMDTAKAASVLLSNPGDPEDYFAGGKREFSKPGVPCVTVPTTAGTGAEVTWDSVVKDRQGIKAFFEHVYIIPSLAIVDPVMSSTMPPRLTASTGADALCHAVESTLAKAANPFTQPLALESIKLISKSLRTAVYHGTNIEARYNMALATTIEAFSESNVGDIEAHGVGHLLGSFYKIPHGTACALALPCAMRHNVVVVPDRLKLVAEAMGEDTSGLTKIEAAYSGIYAVKKLIEDIGLPTTLQEASEEYGVQQKDLPKLAKEMVTIPWLKLLFDTAIRTMTEETALEFLTRMWEGKIGEP
jgi:alcohol dehydrogenase class IV